MTTYNYEYKMNRDRDVRLAQNKGGMGDACYNDMEKGRTDFTTEDEEFWAESNMGACHKNLVKGSRVQNDYIGDGRRFSDANAKQPATYKPPSRHRIPHKLLPNKTAQYTPNRHAEPTDLTEDRYNYLHGRFVHQNITKLKDLPASKSTFVRPQSDTEALRANNREPFLKALYINEFKNFASKSFGYVPRRKPSKLNIKQDMARTNQKPLPQRSQKMGANMVYPDNDVHANNEFRERVIEPVKKASTISQDSLNLAEDLSEDRRPSSKSRGESARSHQTTRSRKADELVQLQKSKCALITAINETIEKIENLTPSLSSMKKRFAPEIGDDGSSSHESLNPHAFANMIKELRVNHYKNIDHEVKNLHFLDTLSEKCQHLKD